MKIKCIVIDDEPLALQQISSYMGKIPYLELVKACSGPTEAMEVLSSEHVDAIFTDIEMPDINGLEYVRNLKDKPIIVFVTAYPNFAVDGFQLDATDYLLKPFGLNDFMRSAEKVKKQYELRSAALTPKVTPMAPVAATPAVASAPAAAPADDNARDYIFVRADSRTVRLRISDIIYVESRKEYVVIFSESSIPVMTLFSLKAMEERLPSDTFMRVHRSYIANLKKIREVASNRIVFSDDMSVPIGEQYKEGFQSYLAQHVWK